MENAPPTYYPMDSTPEISTTKQPAVPGWVEEVQKEESSDFLFLMLASVIATVLGVAFFRWEPTADELPGTLIIMMVLGVGLALNFTSFYQWKKKNQQHVEAKAYAEETKNPALLALAPEIPKSHKRNAYLLMWFVTIIGGFNFCGTVYVFATHFFEAFMEMMS